MAGMSDQLVTVARKGQVTIPVEQRRKYGIREGMKLLVSDKGDTGILLTPVTPLADLAGVDAGKMTVEEMKKRLDKMRSDDRRLVDAEGRVVRTFSENTKLNRLLKSSTRLR